MFKVRWDCSNIGVYKMGQNGLFELQIRLVLYAYKTPNNMVFK